MEIGEHALTKSRNEKFRLVVSGKTVNFGINSLSGGTITFKMRNFRSRMDWQADNGRFYISFLNDNLNFMAVFPRSAAPVSAKRKIYYKI